jgi:hypothetical protein
MKSLMFVDWWLLGWLKYYASLAISVIFSAFRMILLCFSLVADSRWMGASFKKAYWVSFMALIFYSYEIFWLCQASLFLPFFIYLSLISIKFISST